MVDRKSTLETAKSVQPVLSILQIPKKTISKDADEEYSMAISRLFRENIWWRHLVAGGLAGATSRTLTAPLDRIKIYTQVYNPKTSLASTLKFLIKQDGVLKLWRGNSINVMKIVPESATKFTSYEKIKRLLRGGEQREFAIYERFLAGSAAGGIAQTICFPLEVLKVRLALTPGDQNASMRHISRYMWYNEGIRSFYRGYLPNLLGSMPYAGIEFTIYESLKRRYNSLLGLGEEPNYMMLVLFSSLSTMTGQCCVYPLNLIRTRYQSGRMGNISLYSAFGDIYRNEGPRGFYRGLSSNICKVVPSVSINFVVYEFVSRRLGVFMS